jgi:hypothetical protein
MSSDIEEMAREGMRQFTATMQVPPDLAARTCERHRRRTRCKLTGLAAGATAVAASAAVAVTALAPASPQPGSPSAHGTGTIRTAAFTLVSNANGTATLTINPTVLLKPGILQRDLAHDGIPAMVRVGSFCSSDPAPAGFTKVVSFQGSHAVTINPAAMPAGTELSFGNVQLTNGKQTFFTLIDTGSYACTTAPTTPSGDGAWLGPS